MSAVTLVNLLFLAVGATYVAKRVLDRKQNRAPPPPGPSPLPIVGNIADLPPSGEQEWQHWHKHKDLYGPISCVTALGQMIVILNDAQLAFELLEKRSTMYSSRPRMVFGGELVGWENTTGLIPYSNRRFRAHRRNLHAVIGTKQLTAQFNTLQDVEVRRFLVRVLEKPEDLVQHIRTEAGAVILKMAYGYTIEPHKQDPLVSLADVALDYFSRSAAPGAWLVDIIPQLKYLPNWFPGAGFKRTAADWRLTLTDLADRPFEFVRRQMAQGTNEPSYLSKLLEKNDGDIGPEEEFVAKWSAASLYGGGADTTVSSLTCFFLAMTMHPEVQRKAQEEIDRVVGNRLPNFDDRESLPYVDAIVKEVLRWHPIGPMGLPHMTTSDDVVNGYLIPKGALILPNIWSFTHDPKTYHDPMTFKPERFLPSEGRDPEFDPHNLIFGFGRRICPGRVFADGSIYLTIVQSLAVFNIGKAVENGKEVDPVVRFEPGVISHPAPFKTSIKPRSPEHEGLIRSILTECPWQESHAKSLESIESAVKH